MTLYPGAHVSTPGASPQQAGQVYGALANGNKNALNTGKMGINDVSGGDFAAANGLFN